MLESEDVVSCTLAGSGAVGGEGQTDPVRLKSSSQSRTLQAVSEWPADSSVCLSVCRLQQIPGFSPVCWLR